MTSSSTLIGRDCVENAELVVLRYCHGIASLALHPMEDERIGPHGLVLTASSRAQALYSRSGQAAHMRLMMTGCANT
jgi:hypothetical protein